MKKILWLLPFRPTQVEMDAVGRVVNETEVEWVFADGIEEPGMVMVESHCDYAVIDPQWVHGILTLLVDVHEVRPIYPVYDVDHSVKDVDLAEQTSGGLEKRRVAGFVLGDTVKHHEGLMMNVYAQCPLPHIPHVREVTM